MAVPTSLLSQMAYPDGTMKTPPEPGHPVPPSREPEKLCFDDVIEAQPMSGLQVQHVFPTGNGVVWEKVIAAVKEGTLPTAAEVSIWLLDPILLTPLQLIVKVAPLVSIRPEFVSKGVAIAVDQCLGLCWENKHQEAQVIEASWYVERIRRVQEMRP